MTVFYIQFHLTTQLPRKSAKKHSRSLPNNFTCTKNVKSIVNTILPVSQILFLLVLHRRSFNHVRVLQI